MLRHSRFSHAVPRAQLQTALLQAGWLFGTDPAPTSPLTEGEGGGQELSEGPRQQDVPSQGLTVTPGSLPIGKCREPCRKLPEKRPKGQSAPQAPSQRLLLHEAPALPAGSVIASSRGTTVAEARLGPCHARRPHAAASGAQRG